MHLQKIVNSLKGLFFLGALLLLLTFSASNTFADFYVIAGSKGVGTKINALPYTISSSGFYFIAKDLSCAAGSHGIEITADNVTLDLMGFSLIGPGDTGSSCGIYMNTRTNVEIRNGTVRNFAYCGIRENTTGGTGDRIINIRVKDNFSHGIYLSGKSHLIKQCTAVSNGGIGIAASLGSTVTGNTCYNNTVDGIGVGTGSTVTGNTCYNNSDDGISAGLGCTVTGNTCYNNINHGIRLSEYCLVDQNTAYSINSGTDIDSTAHCVYGTNNPMTTAP